jgi:AcrR family transcriptional regulator
MPRKYELKKRAESQEQTRQRIVEATVELHEALGPAKTTISAIAERAGVQRLTVYRHFPDEESVFRACTSHWAARHPAPDPAGWAGVADPIDRLRLALTELYAYFEGGEPMLASSRRDLPHLPALAKVLAEREAPYRERVRRALVADWAMEDERRTIVLAAIGHATAFPTWQSLVREGGVTNEQAVALMVCLITCAAGEYHAR